EGLVSFPPIMLGLLVLAATTPSLTKAVIAVGIVYVPVLIRITRSVTLDLINEEFIQAARARRTHVLHPRRRNSAECLAADRGRGEPAHHIRDPARRGAELCRHGCAATELRLGIDDRGSPALHRPRALDRARARICDVRDGNRHQPARRRSA